LIDGDKKNFKGEFMGPKIGKRKRVVKGRVQKVNIDQRDKTKREKTVTDILRYVSTHWFSQKCEHVIDDDGEQE